MSAFVAVDCGGSYISTQAGPRQGAAPTPGAPSHGSAPAQASPASSIQWSNLALGPGGAPCVNLVTLPQVVAPTLANLAVVHAFTSTQVSLFGLCPQAGATAPVVAVNPAVLAVRFWETIPLPAPHPVIPPGYAITGKAAYLVTNGTVTPAPFAQGTALGALSIVAHGSYSIDWGDGAASGPFGAESQGYPNGTIVHTYDNVGTYTVTVTETWTADWQLGAAHGTLNQLHTQAAIPGFGVRQVQALITG